MSYLTNAVKQVFRAAGLDVHRNDPTGGPSSQLARSLKRFDIDLVLDVGANIGQFGAELRAAGYDGDIVSFEPLSTAYKALVSAASSDPHWTVHPRCAVGDIDGEVKINIAGNSYSSSLLPMLDLLKTAAQDSVYVGAETTPIHKLDDVAAKCVGASRSVFLKIDTQGYEWQVLNGARDLLPRIKGVMCELSLAPLYDGQRLWLDVLRRLEAEGFSLWAIRNAFSDRRDGRTLQIDGVFFRL